VARRFAAVLLLALSSFTAAYSLSPLMASECVCDHPADVPCDCPHHQGHGDAAPCHRHMHAAHAPASKGSALRNHCGAKPPLLLLEAQAAAPRPVRLTVRAIRLEPLPEPHERAVLRAIAPERRPPRAAV
jgi:hypothetical protein